MKELRQPKIDGTSVTIRETGPGEARIQVNAPKGFHVIDIEYDGEDLVVSHVYKTFGVMVIPIEEEDASTLQD